MECNDTILIIDDEEHIRDSCQQILTKVGYRTELAENGDIGLQKLSDIKPDLAIIDLRMPGISGMDLLDKIRDIDPELISVVITGYATIESAVEAMKRGAYDYLPKPFTPDELRIIARRGLEKRKLSLESATLRREKEKLKEYFITLVSHELRSPLVAVQQYFYNILGGFVGEVTIKQEEILKRCQERIKGLLKLIEDWLNMSRIDNGEIVDKREPLALTPILIKVIDFLRTLAERYKITVNIQSSSDLPLVLGERETLEVVFTNLISNSIKYNMEGGNVRIGLREDGNYMAIEITDTGLGIPENELPFIFDEFYRIRNKETRNIMGSGLGLPIAKKIVEAHSGWIQATSEQGKGSVFTVFLPSI